MKIIDVLNQVFPEYSKSELRRLMDQGGIWLAVPQDSEIIQCEEDKTRGGIIILDELVLRIGKKKFKGIRWIPPA